MTYDQVWWPILGICALHLSHPKCAHTAVNTHTPWTLPGAVGSHLCCGAREQLGVQCLAQGHLSRGIEGVESAVHSLPPPTIPAGPETRNLSITSLTLTIRPRLPTNILRSYEAKQSDCARNWTWFTPLSPRTTDSAKNRLYCSTEEKCHLHLWWPEGESVNSKLSFLANIPSMALELRVKSKL